MSNLQVDVQGFEELKRKIQQLANDKDKKKEVLMILRQVAKPTLAAARSTVPQSKKAHWISGSRTKQKLQPGTLKKALGLITSKSENPTILVGARAKNGNIGFYGAMVSEGHNIYNKGFKRKRNGDKKHNATGAKSRTKAQPFLKQAYAATQSAVTADTEKKMTAFVQRRIDKLSTS